jgi:tetratricopeptide (TPR) repeat protein
MTTTKSPAALRSAPLALALLAWALAFAGSALADGDPGPSDEAAAAEAEEQEEPHATGLSRRVAEKLGKAIELYEKDRFDDALEIVDALAKRRRLRPADVAQIHRFRGYILLSQGNSEAAAAEFQQSLAQHALDPFAEQQTTYSLAQLYTQLGKYDQALGLIDQWFAAAKDPKPDAYFLKAMILVQQKKFEAALEPATQAVEAAETPRESWVQLLVAIHIEREDWASVAKYLERLVAIAPAKKQYWIQLAAVRNHLRQDARALATLRLADRAELLTEDRDLRQLSRLLFVRELPFECAQEIEGAIDAGVVKGDADAYRMLANCYVAARETEKALEPLAKAGALSEDGEMYLLLAQIHLQRERYEPALEVLRKALAKSKPEQRGSVQLLIGVAQLGANRFDEAERAFRAAAADPKVGDAAKSYLKFVEEQRLREQQEEQLRQPETIAQR